MDKRKQANIRVKTSITNALFSLMKNQQFSQISISDIIRNAHVARASFYRNYTSKENVLTTLIRDILEEYKTTATYDLSNYASAQNVKRAFDFFKKYRDYVLNLYHCGFSTMLLEELNSFHESIADNVSPDSPARYKLYAFIGALYNTAIIWLEEKEPAKSEVVTDVLLSNLRV